MKVIFSKEQPDSILLEDVTEEHFVVIFHTYKFMLKPDINNGFNFMCLSMPLSAGHIRTGGETIQEAILRYTDPEYNLQVFNTLTEVDEWLKKQ